jgi:hypothetical protein
MDVIDCGRVEKANSQQNVVEFMRNGLGFRQALFSNAALALISNFYKPMEKSMGFFIALVDLCPASCISLPKLPSDFLGRIVKSFLLHLSRSRNSFAFIACYGATRHGSHLSHWSH